MRLIDADKFKEDLLKLWDYNTVDGITATTVLKQVISDLDNAPTLGYEDGMLLVDIKDQIAGAYNEGYACGGRENTRPQGEWKLDSLGAYCSECGTHPDYTTNFCPNCGARMVKNEID